MQQSFDDQPFASELKFLAENGFTKERKNVRLLTKTNGNLDVVVNFLKAQIALHEALIATKKSIKETKETLKSFESLHFGETDKKADKKEFKRERKEAKKADKKRGNEDRELEKQAKKEEKRIKKDERKAEREAKKMIKKQEDVPLTALPENIKNVWLDGNNMLFVTSAIRNTCLRSKLRNGEKLLEAMARAWTNQSDQIAKCTLIFDDTTTHLSEHRFEVLSARPKYPTSDHALIEWATNANSDDKSGICVFTSDRALTESLKNAGVSVFKSKKWYQLALTALPIEGAEQVDDWAEKWIAANKL